jgi:molybdopterin-guanine dinucleotide biosynthesis protein A
MGTDDKVLLEVGGRSMLSRVIEGVRAAGRIVVVGPRRVIDVDVEIAWCREQPEGSGPAAALRTGLEHVAAELVVVVAGDQPFVDDDTVRRLVAGVRDAPVRDDGAVAVDASLQPQWLCSAWRTAALRTAPLAANESLRVAFGQLQWRPVPVEAHAAFDCDTPEDLQRAREIAG